MALRAWQKGPTGYPIVDAAMVRASVPELARLPDAFLHKPWAAPPLALREAGIKLGETCPHPLVDHPTARKRALAAFEQLKNFKSS